MAGAFRKRPGLDGLLDEPSPGRPRTESDERVEDVVVRALESAPPDGGTHWSTRQMARQTELSLSTVSLDEKSQIQALERSQPILPLLPGTPACRRAVE